MAKWVAKTFGFGTRSDQVEERARAIASYLSSLPKQIARDTKIFGVLTKEDVDHGRSTETSTTTVIIHEELP